MNDIPNSSNEKKPIDLLETVLILLVVVTLATFFIIVVF